MRLNSSEKSGVVMDDKKYSAPAAKKVMEILEVMAGGNKNYTVTELSQLLSVSSNSVFRIMKELETKNYVVKNSYDSSYRLTPKLYFLGNSLKPAVSIVREAAETMAYLSQQTGETILLTRLDESLKTLVLEQYESTQPIKFISSIGFAYDSYSSAMGKCLLAFLDRNRLEKYLENTELKPKTEKTVTDKELFLKQLSEIRIKGIAYDMEESNIGLTCVACPVFCSEKQVAGAIGISGLSFRMSGKTLEIYSALLKNACEKLSEKLDFKI